MKKNKEAASPTIPAVQTFGGDYHKYESTFRPRHTASVAVSAGKRTSAKGKRKERSAQRD